MTSATCSTWRRPATRRRTRQHEGPQRTKQVDKQEEKVGYHAHTQVDKQEEKVHPQMKVGTPALVCTKQVDKQEKVGYQVGIKKVGYHTQKVKHHTKVHPPVYNQKEVDTPAQVGTKQANKQEEKVGYYAQVGTQKVGYHTQVNSKVDAQVDKQEEKGGYHTQVGTKKVNEKVHPQVGGLTKVNEQAHYTKVCTQKEVGMPRFDQEETDDTLKTQKAVMDEIRESLATGMYFYTMSDLANLSRVSVHHYEISTAMTMSAMTGEAYGNENQEDTTNFNG